MRYSCVLFFALLLVAACARPGESLAGDAVGAQGNESGPWPPGASGELARALDTEGREWRVAYDMMTSANGSGSANGTMVQYVKGRNLSRTDIVMQGTEVRAYHLEGTYLTCTRTGADWRCLQIGDPGSDLAATQRELRENAAKYGIRYDGSMTVIGADAECYRVMAMDESSTSRYCFSRESVPLYIRMQDENATTELFATGYVTSVNESDFEPPAEPASLGAGPPSTPAGSTDACGACALLAGDDLQRCLESCR